MRAAAPSHTSMYSRRTTALLAAVTCACTAAPPEFEYRTPTGIARSDDEAVARELGILADHLSAPVSAELGVERTPQFVIHHIPSHHAIGLLVARDGEGKILDRRIHIGDESVAQAPFAIAHELVHWYASGPWERLPHALEEGLADWIALQLVPEVRAIREAELDAILAEITPERRALALAISKRTWAATPTQVRSDSYAVGYEIVRRLGVARMRALCERAESEQLARAPLVWFGVNASSSPSAD